VFPRLKARDIGPFDFGHPGQLILGQSTLFAKGFDPFSNALADFRILVSGFSRGEGLYRFWILASRLLGGMGLCPPASPERLAMGDRDLRLHISQNYRSKSSSMEPNLTSD
jgi:hypothetical protein